MPTIRHLDQSTINKIAAGEVIERPASVVKELLENAIDAKADDIRIDLLRAGKQQIKLSDNGSGMAKDDLLICYKKHTTSKISGEQDLFTITSLGFRGEALASIAEIANLKITTKTKDNDTAERIEVEAGKIIRLETTAAPDGTTVDVANLFFNTPARKAYLKPDAAEVAAIINIVERYALLYYDKAFRLTNDRKEILKTPKAKSIAENTAFIYGSDIGRSLLEISYADAYLKVDGALARPSVTRADKSQQSIFVNGRYIRSRLITDEIYETLHTLLFHGRNPIFVLHIAIGPQETDVNVHPAKTFIKFRNESAVRHSIRRAIEDAIERYGLSVQETTAATTARRPSLSYEFPTESQKLLVRELPLQIIPQVKAGLGSEKGSGLQEEKRIGPFTIIGQLNRTYIIAESPEGLAVIDQHAAEERVNYERFMQEKKEGAIKKQHLLKEKSFELSPLLYHTATGNAQFLRSLGFSFEDFGSNTLKLNSIPEIFGRLKSTLFIDLLHELAKEKQKAVCAEIEERIIRFACRASVKAGDALTEPQMNGLIRRLRGCSNPFTCPHGRPTFFTISLGDLEKRFRRAG
ncbi:TPA: DNA mismatch repair endonuclease MutL [Candidatus Woesearchaeota archaeon]|nr:DNA mismatch repair endonuclease MutL [Candidatus Woesearchaeota archaeon]HII68703.1 DNA mismatch repair endonuclease MutL [Candidatus Woesearchaeota archaeon]